MSLMLDPEEVDDGYFTPVTSTTLASIFKDDSNNDAAVNPTLKYRPPQPKRPEQSSKPDDASTSQCLFSCSIIAYEWVNGTHKCKGKVGFAMMQIVKTGQCKIILYSPDKSTLSCITITAQLEVTLKGSMISLYDDHKKYWGLCFNDKNIDEVKELLKRESVIIKHYVNPEYKPEIENIESDETTDETDSMAEDLPPMSRTDKASILNRIANVGHAILPSLPESPIKKSTPVDVFATPEISNSVDKLNLLPELREMSSSNNTSAQDLDPTKTITIKASQDSSTTLSSIFTNKFVQSAQTSTSLPLVNNQIFTYVNGYMVPLHMQVPVMVNDDGVDTSSEFDLIIHKLTHLKGIVRAMEMKKLFQSNEIIKEQTCACKSQGNDTTSNKSNKQNDNDLKNILILEQMIKEKDDVIVHLRNEVQNEIKKNHDTTKDQLILTSDLHQEIKKLKQDINTKNEELKEMIPREEADMVLANIVKTLMNNTFRSLASNFDSEDSYSGTSVKAVLAAVIKKNTVESLSNLFSNRETQNKSTEPVD